MNQVTPRLKVVIAILSLLLTFFVWQRGLEESFDRPSVAPTLIINQREIALLAEPALPEPFKKVLVGSSPETALIETLSEIPLKEMGPRQKLLLASFEDSVDQRVNLLQDSISEPNLKLVKNLLLKNFSDEDNLQLNLKKLKQARLDPLLYQRSCLFIGVNKDLCIDKSVSNAMAFRLAGSQFMPSFAVLMGIGLILRQSWRFIRKANTPWPDVSSIPLSLIDMVLLIAGGFVLLGEVISPLFSLSFIDSFAYGLSAPIKESLKVFAGYIGMTVPPLFIYRRQINNIKDAIQPIGGWAQWHFLPIKKAFADAVQGWLIITPFVLLTSLVMNLFVGDPGGSNPLLEMVLMSKNFWALGIIFFTTAVVAPLFEEFVFRGVLLPVLVDKQGRFLGVILSAFIFALAHLSVGELLPLFVLGIGLAFLRLSSGRLFPCIIMHSLWNGVTFVSLLLLSA